MTYFTKNNTLIEYCKHNIHVVANGRLSLYLVNDDMMIFSNDENDDILIPSFLPLQGRAFQDLLLKQFSSRLSLIGLPRWLSW